MRYLNAVSLSRSDLGSVIMFTNRFYHQLYVNIVSSTIISSSIFSLQGVIVRNKLRLSLAVDIFHSIASDLNTRTHTQRENQIIFLVH